MIVWVRLSSKNLNIFLVSLYFFPYYVCYLLTVIIELVYWQNITSIRDRIVNLNRKIQSLINRENNIIDYLINCQKCRNQSTKFKFSSTSSNQIRDLIKAFEKIADASNTINNCFGFIILVRK